MTARPRPPGLVWDRSAAAFGALCALPAALGVGSALLAAAGATAAPRLRVRPAAARAEKTLTTSRRAARPWFNQSFMDAINELGRADFVRRFGGLFEHSPWVAEAAWGDRPFDGREGLFDALVAAMYAAPRERKLELIRAHPDLAGKAAIEGTLTGSSRREQASAGLDRLTPDEYAAFTSTNTAYRERFGFPFVVCAREHTKESILRVAAERLGNSEDEEIRVALEEIAKIAWLRLEDAL